MSGCRAEYVTACIHVDVERYFDVATSKPCACAYCASLGPLGPGVYVYEYLWHRWSRDFGLEASGPGKQESKFDSESN